jgi:hypothetical protein
MKPDDAPPTPATPPPPDWDPEADVRPGRRVLVAFVGMATVLGLLAVGALAAVLILRGATEPDASSSGPLFDTPARRTTGIPSAAPSGATVQPADNGIVARHDTDFRAVCEGGSVVNAAPYRKGGKVKILAFSKTGVVGDLWGPETVDSGRPYASGHDAVTTVNVVACLHRVDGTERRPSTCRYQDQSNKPVDVAVVPVRYRLVFYTARSGEEVAQGGTVNGPSTPCPALVLYDRQTKRTYADPDRGALTAALDRFVGV